MQSVNDCRSLVRSETNQLLDAKNAIFVFLFRVESSEADAVMPEWQAYLEQQWAHSGMAVNVLKTLVITW